MITYRANRTGTLEAAYMGGVRVGYLAVSDGPEPWVWSLSLLRPSGGFHMGREATRELAVARIDEAVREWVAAAGLQQAEEKKE